MKKDKDRRGIRLNLLFIDLRRNGRVHERVLEFEGGILLLKIFFTYRLLLCFTSDEKSANSTSAERGKGKDISESTLSEETEYNKQESAHEVETSSKKFVFIFPNFVLVVQIYW